MTHGLSQKTPYQSSYLDPVYNDADLDEDGMIDNPYSKPTEAEVNAKLKELQDAWDAANG